MNKIAIKDLVKIFGDKPEKALPLLGQRRSQKGILAETGQTVAVADASDKLVGILVQGSLLAGLTDKGRTDNGI